MDPQWQNVITDTEFPVKQGEVVVVKCKRKHINLGVRSLTCVNGTSFVETKTKPSCMRIGKLGLLKFNNRSSKRVRETGFEVDRFNPRFYH